MANYYIEFYDYSFGCGTTSRVYLKAPKKGEVDMEKCLKKYYNRLEKKLAKADVTIFAIHEANDEIEDLTAHWAFEYMQHYPDIPFC